MNKYFKLFLCIVGCQLTGIIGAAFTNDAISSWYAYLNKPPFSPPNWVFGPVWTTLYCLMGISLYLILETKGKTKAVKDAAKYFYIQLALNLIWTPFFFGLRSTLLGLIIVIPLWVFIVLTMKKFYPLSKTASYLLIPYLLWVSFATILNASLFWLN